jgi:hypothetical protein
MVVPWIRGGPPQYGVAAAVGGLPREAVPVDVHVYVDVDASEVTTKVCPACDEAVPTADPRCTPCGHRFTPPRWIELACLAVVVLVMVALYVQQQHVADRAEDRNGCGVHTQALGGATDGC